MIIISTGKSIIQISKRKIKEKTKGKIKGKQGKHEKIDAVLFFFDVCDCLYSVYSYRRPSTTVMVYDIVFCRIVHTYTCLYMDKQRVSAEGNQPLIPAGRMV